MAADPGLDPTKDNEGGREAIVAEAVAIVDEIERAGATARLLGGIAIALHSTPPGEQLAGHRQLNDIDLIIDRRDMRTVKKTLDACGCEPNARFNTLNGRERLMYFGKQGHIDVFTEFDMCHSIDLRKRLILDSPTLTASDLLLTKLQVRELTKKDLDDVVLLVEHHQIHTEEGDVINASYAANVLSDDWGFWRTLTGNLRHIASAQPALEQKVERLFVEIDRAPKTLKFRARAKVGEKKRWYNIPEESVR